MEYVIINSTASISKIKVEYQCPHCGTQLKNPIDEAGTKDQCPECGGGFEVPGKKDYEKFTQRDLEERMKTASIDLMKSKVVAEAEEKKVKSRSASDHLRSLSKTRINSTMKWTDKVNFWLAKTVAELNGYLFILICLCGFIAGGLQLVQIDLQSGAGQFFLRVFLCTAMILSSILGGILACGYTAIICSMHKSLNQMSKVE